MGVKEKRVELIELFHDLIYVYAVSRLTLLIDQPTLGVVSAPDMLRYLVVSLVILQAWLYLTNYVNRYGRWRPYEYALVVVNMTATVFMTNTISVAWADMSAAFNLSMLVMLLTVAALYLSQVLLGEQDTAAARNSLQILTVDCALYLLAFVVSWTHLDALVLLIDSIAVLVGAFLPFFLRGHFDPAIISFPHLAERFELIVIITFGEAVTRITGFFDVTHPTLVPILVFCSLLALFGAYVVQIHYLCNHHRVARALRLMFSHYIIVISLNLVTVAITYLRDPHVVRAFTAGLLWVGLALFFCALIANAHYYHEQYRLTPLDCVLIGACVAGGLIVALAFIDDTYAFLIGTLVSTAGPFCVLADKYRRGLSRA